MVSRRCSFHQLNKEYVRLDNDRLYDSIGKFSGYLIIFAHLSGRFKYFAIDGGEGIAFTVDFGRRTHSYGVLRYVQSVLLRMKIVIH